MRDLPSGTVTFLFTDIEGSTRLLDELGERYADFLAEHHRLMRGAFEQHRGVEVDTQGDAFFVAFERASDAVSAAAAAQEALAAGPVKVRMGVHTGEPALTEEGYVGMDVHRAARVMAAGHGGQVLISSATRDLLDDRFRLRELGAHRLKDLSAPQHLFQLGDGDFPPLRTLHQTNLPVQPAPLIGREAELAVVLALVQESRLVTLTGAGGSGKTRLALQAAAELVDDFKDGVWWVSLAALRETELVEPTIAQAVGANDGVVDHLRSKQTLLLLDNFEQLLDAAPKVSALLAEATDLRVLATSRERLGVAAEQEYAVPTMVAAEAVALFTTRAQKLRPDFEPDDAVAEICRRLDGLPLAIELAAARVKVLRPDQILERLAHSLDLLTSGARDAPERQQTLRATIEWGYELLSPDERQTFADLSVFPGSFDLEAAEVICGAALDDLAALVDKSLLRQTDEGRLFLLETIREFAGDRLLASGRTDELRRRHLAFFRELSARATKQLAEHGQASTVRLFDGERENFRAALATASEMADFEAVAEVAGNVAARWTWAGGVIETTKWLELALENAADEHSAQVATLHRRLGDAAFAAGDLEKCERLHLEALGVFRAEGDALSAAGSLVRLAQAASLRGDTRRAAHYAEEMGVEAEAAGVERLKTVAQSLQAEIAAREGDYRRARRLYGAAIAQFRAQGEDASLALDLAALALAELIEGEDALAETHVREALLLLQTTGGIFALVGGLEVLAALLVRRGKTKIAAALLATVKESCRDHGFALQAEDERLHEQSMAAVGAESASAEPLPIEDAISRGLAALD